MCIITFVGCFGFFSGMPSMLWRCWLGGRKGIRPVKIWVVGCWCGCRSGARCRLAYGPADATVSCSSKIQINFTFLVPAYPGSPGQRAVKWVCVCLCNFFWKNLPIEVDNSSSVITAKTYHKSITFSFQHLKNIYDSNNKTSYLGWL